MVTLSSSTIGILGSGIVGVTLANGLQSVGYTVSVGSRTGKTIDGWAGETGTFEEVAERADIVVLAVKGTSAEDVITSVRDRLASKTVIDTTNPITDEPPEEGVIRYFTGPNDSLMERLQAAAPKAHLVKAFNSVGNAVMVKPKFAGGTPTMFICGNDTGAKSEVGKILAKLGWEVEDCGSVKSARAIEPLCMLWCIPGFLHNDWTHTYKLLKP